MKLYKLKRNKTEIDAPEIVAPFHPGIREDNMWLQYTPNMNQKDLETYWKKPFTVKPEMGFYAWKKITKLRLVDDRVLNEPDFLGKAYMNFFSDKTKLEKFIELNTIEVKKGEDVFSMDKGMLYCELFESFGPQLLPIFTPYVLKFTASSEECQQRWASEVVFGLIKGK